MQPSGRGSATETRPSAVTVRGRQNAVLLANTTAPIQNAM